MTHSLKKLIWDYFSDYAAEFSYDRITTSGLSLSSVDITGVTVMDKTISVNKSVNVHMKLKSSNRSPSKSKNRNYKIFGGRND
jgi:hypothetical protein